MSNHPHPNLGEPSKLAKGALRLVALGGLGEIGRNMMVYEYDNELLESLCSVCHRKEHGIEIKPKIKKKPKSVATKQSKKKKLIRNKIMIAIKRANED